MLRYDVTKQRDERSGHAGTAQRVAGGGDGREHRRALRGPGAGRTLREGAGPGARSPPRGPGAPARYAAGAARPRAAGGRGSAPRRLVSRPRRRAPCRRRPALRSKPPGALVPGRGPAPGAAPGAGRRGHALLTTAARASPTPSRVVTSAGDAAPGCGGWTGPRRRRPDRRRRSAGERRRGPRRARRRCHGTRRLLPALAGGARLRDAAPVGGPHRHGIRHPDPAPETRGWARLADRRRGGRAHGRTDGRRLRLRRSALDGDAGRVPRRPRPDGRRRLARLRAQPPRSGDCGADRRLRAADRGRHPSHAGEPAPARGAAAGGGGRDRPARGCGGELQPRLRSGHDLGGAPSRGARCRARPVPGARPALRPTLQPSHRACRRDSLADVGGRRLRAPPDHRSPAARQRARPPLHEVRNPRCAARRVGFPPADRRRAARAPAALAPHASRGPARGIRKLSTWPRSTPAREPRAACLRAPPAAPAWSCARACRRANRDPRCG